MTLENPKSIVNVVLAKMFDFAMASAFVTFHWLATAYMNLLDVSWRFKQYFSSNHKTSVEPSSTEWTETEENNSSHLKPVDEHQS